MVNHTKTAPAELDVDGSTDDLGSLYLSGVVDSDDCVESCSSFTLVKSDSAVPPGGTPAPPAPAPTT